MRYKFELVYKSQYTVGYSNDEKSMLRLRRKYAGFVYYSSPEGSKKLKKLKKCDEEHKYKAYDRTFEEINKEIAKVEACDFRIFTNEGWWVD